MTKIRQWTALTVIAVLLVFAAGWFLLIKPQRSKAATLRTQAVSQQQSNQVLQTQIAALQQEQKNLPQQQQILEQFSRQVPNGASEPTLIRQLSAAATGSGVDLVSLAPGQATLVSAATSTSTSLQQAAPTGNQLAELPVTIAIDGSYPNVESFFQSVEKLPRSVLVTGWSLCPTNSSASSATSSSASCALPSIPNATSLPAGTLGGTLSAVVFFSPPAAAGSTTSTTGNSTTPTAAASSAPAK